MSKKLKPLTIFLSDDELVNFKSHFDEFLNMNYDDKIKEQQQEIERLNNIIKELEKYLRNEEAEYDRLYEEQDEQEYLEKYFATRNVLDRLQELKGSDKE